MKQQVTVLGCTGSIGVSTLDVLARHPGRYQVYALCAHSQVDKLLDQCRVFHPRFAVLKDAALAKALGEKLKLEGIATEVLFGIEALEQMAAAPEVDVVMAAIVGAAGLRPALAAARTGKRILLANKESLVMTGQLFMDAVKGGGATLLPVDSEHNAIFQSLPDGYRGNPKVSGIRRLLLTASGGPFRQRSLESLEGVTPDEACAHPNWSMGRKISVDSASMMNKGLELIEAHWLFNVAAKDIEVVVHPQSVIHSMVEYVDGSIVAQLGNPDMRTPIAHSLAYPERIEAGVSSLDLFKVARLDFEAPDFVRFPCLKLAYDALAAGGAAPAVVNAANEVAVQSFLEGQLGFLDIPRVIARTLEKLDSGSVDSLDGILERDAEARARAQEFVGEVAR